MAVLKYKDQQGNWQTLDTGSGSVSSVEITSLPYGSEPTARISAGVLYIGWPDGVPVDSVITDESDNPVTSAAIYQALQDTPGMAPVQSVNGQTGAVVLDAQDVGAYEKPASGIPASDLADGVIPAVPVQDVQVNGVSVLNDGVANVPIAGQNDPGVVKYYPAGGVSVDSSNRLVTNPPSEQQIKEASSGYRPIVPSNQHKSVFYGLAKAAGDATQSASSNPVGTYTDAAKVAIQKMLGIYEAPWELIREDTVTNAAAADIEITVDGNGNAFELTDVYIFIYLPNQENSASVGSSGKIEFYYASNEYHALYCSATSQSAGESAKGAWAMITNDNGAMISRNCAYNTTGTDRNYVYARTRGDAADPLAYLIPGNFTYSKVIIKAVTGTAKYKFYGKRKWN